MKTLIVVLILVFCLTSVTDARARRRRKSAEIKFKVLCQTNAQNNVEIGDIALLPPFNDMMKKCPDPDLKRMRQNRRIMKKKDSSDVAEVCEANENEGDPCGIEESCNTFVKALEKAGGEESSSRGSNGESSSRSSGSKSGKSSK